MAPGEGASVRQVLPLDLDADEQRGMSLLGAFPDSNFDPESYCVLTGCLYSPPDTDPTDSHITKDEMKAYFNPFADAVGSPVYDDHDYEKPVGNIVTAAFDTETAKLWVRLLLYNGTDSQREVVRRIRSREIRGLSVGLMKYFPRESGGGPNKGLLEASVTACPAQGLDVTRIVKVFSNPSSSSSSPAMGGEGVQGSASPPPDPAPADPQENERQTEAGEGSRKQKDRRTGPAGAEQDVKKEKTPPPTASDRTVSNRLPQKRTQRGPYRTRTTFTDFLRSSDITITSDTNAIGEETAAEHSTRDRRSSYSELLLLPSDRPATGTRMSSIPNTPATPATPGPSATSSSTSSSSPPPPAQQQGSDTTAQQSHSAGVPMTNKLEGIFQGLGKRKAEQISSAQAQVNENQQGIAEDLARARAAANQSLMDERSGKPRDSGNIVEERRRQLNNGKTAKQVMSGPSPAEIKEQKQRLLKIVDSLPGDQAAALRQEIESLASMSHEAVDVIVKGQEEREARYRAKHMEESQALMAYLENQKLIDRNDTKAYERLAKLLLSVARGPEGNILRSLYDRLVTTAEEYQKQNALVTEKDKKTQEVEKKLQSVERDRDALWRTVQKHVPYDRLDEVRRELGQEPGQGAFRQEICAHSDNPRKGRMTDFFHKDHPLGGRSGSAPSTGYAGYLTQGNSAAQSNFQMSTPYGSQYAQQQHQSQQQSQQQQASPPSQQGGSDQQQPPLKRLVPIREMIPAEKLGNFGALQGNPVLDYDGIGGSLFQERYNLNGKVGMPVGPRPEDLKRFNESNAHLRIPELRQHLGYTGPGGVMVGQ